VKWLWGPSCCMFWITIIFHTYRFSNFVLLGSSVSTAPRPWAG
jgi:hypothetical protein